MTYAIEAWYPSQVVLQNSIERVKKFAAKLTTNNFKSPYPTLLEKVDWKPISRITVERRRAVIVYNYVQGRRTLPDNAIVLQSIESTRHSQRVGHGMELTTPITKLEAVLNSSLNTVKRIWNTLPAELVAIASRERFKFAVKDPAVYAQLINKKVVHYWPVI
jgi:hypothetical protein